MNKNKVEKAVAKIVWNAMLIITIMAVILLVSALGAMIEMMGIANAPLIISVACVAWIVAFSAFVSWANK